MAENRLQRLSELGQSVWIDNLSRPLVREGGLTRLIEDDAVVGVTSNPTIFQKALAEGDAYDEQMREVIANESDNTEEFFQLATRRRLRRLRPAAAESGTAAAAATATCRSRSRPTSPTTPRAPSPRPSGCTSGRPAQPAGQDPRHRAGPGRDRGDDRPRPPDQRHPDLLAAPLRPGRRGLPARARAPRRVGRRPLDRRLGRVVLRLARGHRGRQPPRRHRRPRRAARARRSRTPSSPTSTTWSCSPATAGRRWRPRAPRRSAACGPRRRPRTRPTGTRSTSRSSSAPTRSTPCPRDDRGLPGPRRGPRRPFERTSRAPARCSTRWPRPASTTTTSRRRSSARAWRSSTPVVQGAAGRGRPQARHARRGVGGGHGRHPVGELGQQLRVDSVRASAAAGSGHPTSSMSAADLIAVLIAEHLRFDVDSPTTPTTTT